MVPFKMQIAVYLRHIGHSMLLISSILLKHSSHTLQSGNHAEVQASLRATPKAKTEHVYQHLHRHPHPRKLEARTRRTSLAPTHPSFLSSFLPPPQSCCRCWYAPVLARQDNGWDDQAHAHHAHMLFFDAYTFLCCWAQLCRCWSTHVVLHRAKALTQTGKREETQTGLVQIVCNNTCSYSTTTELQVVHPSLASLPCFSSVALLFHSTLSALHRFTLPP